MGLQEPTLLPQQKQVCPDELSHSQSRQAETKSLTTLRSGLAQEGKEKTNEVCMQGSNWDRRPLGTTAPRWDKHHPGNGDIEEKGQVQRHFLMSTTTELGHSLEVR